MKRNIDLTDSMIFSRNSISINTAILHRYMNKIYGKKSYAWNINCNNGSQRDSIIDRQLQVIHLGDKSERQFIKECIEMDSGNFCDCCGDSLLKHPWSRRFGLCKECDEINEKHIKNKLWPNTRMEVDRQKRLRI